STSSTLKHKAQFKLSRNITADEAPILQSVEATISAIPLPNIPQATQN
ncbi:26734_t:CDS:1, partial [Racocetra persica]